jgi:CRISPR-associated protein Csx17
MTMHLHNLKGCNPTPLASYLKALAILRLVAEQDDAHARGWWDGESFCFLTALSKDELEAFFLERYEPTPLLSPWNKGCGFFKKDDPGLSPIEASQASRFKRFRDGIMAARSLANSVSHADAVIRAIKARTKTNKSFQTDDQRKLLEQSDVFRSSLDELKNQLSKPDLPVDKRVEIERDVSTIKSIVLPTSQPPQRAEAEKLKGSAGYKRLLAGADKRFKLLKATLIPDCRRLWRGPHGDWLSAAVVLDEQGKPDWPSLLGTGGNDGNLDFTNNFMQQLGNLFDMESEFGTARITARELLENSLWMAPANKLASAAVGQYQPASAGGANSSTGFASGNLVNPWDFVLMMEGSLLFTSRATRRLDPNGSSRASAPFAVRPHAAGFATPGLEKAQRGEQWMPLWKQPATLDDVVAMYGESRVQLNRQIANRPVDMARAVSRLGVARGIDAFVRYGYLERNGQSTLAIPLGKVYVRHHPRAYLIDDLAGWMDRVQRRSRDKHAPSRLVHAERNLADAIFAALTHDYAPGRWQSILLTAAAIEAIQATGTAIEAGPIPPLRPEWVAAVNDSSPEMRLALTLGSAAAGYTREGRPFDPIRGHVLALEPGARKFKTTDKRLAHDPRVVMTGRDPIRDLGAVVERRLIEATADGQRRLRLVAAPGCGARLADLAQFLGGELDIDKLVGLARAMMAIRWGGWSRDYDLPFTPGAQMPDEPWLAIRLAFLPYPWISDLQIPADERIVRLLLSGDATRASQLAQMRLRSVGVRSPFQAGVTERNSARLWAAALVFPIDRRTAIRLMRILDPRLDPKKKGALHA